MTRCPLLVTRHLCGAHRDPDSFSVNLSGQLGVVFTGGLEATFSAAAVTIARQPDWGPFQWLLRKIKIQVKMTNGVIDPNETPVLIEILALDD